MSMKISDHSRVASSLKGLSSEELDELKSEFENIFAEIEVRKSAGLDPGYTKKQIEVFVEGYVKIDASQKGKGWWYRSRLRTQLIMKLT